MACVIQVLNGDTETHYVNPVWLTTVIEDPEEAHQVFEDLKHELEVFVNALVSEDVEWETREISPVHTECRVTYPYAFETIFTIEQVHEHKPNLTKFLQNRYS